MGWRKEAFEFECLIAEEKSLHKVWSLLPKIDGVIVNAGG